MPGSEKVTKSHSPRLTACFISEDHVQYFTEHMIIMRTKVHTSMIMEVSVPES